jgi:putative membrane protein
MVSSFLSDADAREIEAAVARVEAQTATEIVVAVVPRSRDYWRGRVLLAVAWALAGGFAFLYFEPWREPALALLLELVVGALAFWLAGLPSLQRRLVSPRAAEQATHDRAFQLFAERGLYGTRGHTGLLIFVSELERRVVMLGDRGLDAQLGQAGWNDHVAHLLERIRQGQARAGIVEVLERLTPQLAAALPRAADDENELPDSVLRG